MKTIFTIILALIYCDLFSQSTIKGVVTDSLNNEIIGVHILELGTENGTVTDFNGKYELTTIKDSTQIIVYHSIYTSKLIYIQSDTILNIKLKEQEIDIIDFYNSKWLTVGTTYDFLNSTLGLKISNGYDEIPLIHFEDFTEDFVFKVQGTTNFNKDYSYGINLGYKNIRYLSLISIGYNENDYVSQDFQYRDLNLNAETYGKHTALMLKIAYQDLNNKQNFGADFGLRYTVLYGKLYCGISAGYYFDYSTYAGFIQGFVYKKLIGINLNYKRIDKFDFLNLGLSFTFER